MNLPELQRKYNSQEKCIRHLERVRWKDGIFCPFCKSTSITNRQKDGRHHCNSCNKNFSVLIGTIFQDSKLSLPKWFILINLMLSAKSGISAKEIQRNLKTTYRTAWYGCMRVRCALIEEKELMEGIVEMDEAYIGGSPRKKNEADNIANLSTVTNKRGRGTNKVPIVGVVSRGASGQVATKVSQRLTSKALLEILKDNVDVQEALLITDEYKGYKKFKETIEHLAINHSKGFSKGIVHVNTIEGFWSTLKNGIKGNYKSVSKKYLPFYLTEYGYKYNKRNTKDDFEKTIDNAVTDTKCFVKGKPKASVESIVYGKKSKAISKKLVAQAPKVKTVKKKIKPKQKLKRKINTR